MCAPLLPQFSTCFRPKIANDKNLQSTIHPKYPSSTYSLAAFQVFTPPLSKSKSWWCATKPGPCSPLSGKIPTQQYAYSRRPSRTAGTTMLRRGCRPCVWRVGWQSCRHSGTDINVGLLVHVHCVCEGNRNTGKINIQSLSFSWL